MGDGVGEAIDRESERIDISEEMEQQIRDLEDQVGDTPMRPSACCCTRLHGQKLSCLTSSISNS